MLCDFDNTSLACKACGYKARRLPTHRECRAQSTPEWKPVPVGDLVERWLTAIGITKERVEKLTRTEGKPGGCGCAARQKWLNEWGNRVQIAARQKLLKVHAFYFGS